MAYFGEWLAKRRADHGLTIKDIAEIVAMPAARVSAWERGLEDPPYEVRDACWDALKQDGELPPLDPAPCLTGKPGGASVAKSSNARRPLEPKGWIEEWAAKKGYAIEDVLKTAGLSTTLKYQWRNGKVPSPAVAVRVIQLLEIPENVARENGWNPNPNSEKNN